MRPLAPAPRLAVAAGLLVLLPSAAPAHADRVRLRTGETVVGRVVAAETDETALVVEDYLDGGRREFDWDVVEADDAAGVRLSGSVFRFDATVAGERIVYRAGVGTAELRGRVEAEALGVLYVRNASSRTPIELPAERVILREPIALAPSEWMSAEACFERRLTELAPRDARAWLRLAVFGERIGAYREARDAYEAAAADGAFRRRDLARDGVRRMGAHLADARAFDDLRAIDADVAGHRFVAARDAIDGFLARHPDAGEVMRAALDDLRASFARRRLAFFAREADERLAAIVRRLVEAKVGPKPAKLGDVLAWIRSSAFAEAFGDDRRGLVAELRGLDPAITSEETRVFLDARPGRSRDWRRASYGESSYLVLGSRGRPATRDTWWETASTEARATFAWASFVDRGGFYEVRRPYASIPCARCDGKGRLTKGLFGGGSLVFLCDRCRGAGAEAVVRYR